MTKRLTVASYRDDILTGDSAFLYYRTGGIPKTLTYLLVQCPGLIEFKLQRLANGAKQFGP